MRIEKKLAALGLMAVIMNFAAQGGLDGIADSVLPNMKQDKYMVNVTVNIPPTASPEIPEVSPPPEDCETSSEAVSEDNAAEVGIYETTISGGLKISNETEYVIDISQYLSTPPDISLDPDEPQILIIHTHSSEAYTPAGLDKYVATDTNRTEDTDFNIIRVGDEMTKLLEDVGLHVIHDRGIYDYPSYTGSYSRSGAAVEQYLEQYPSIKIVIDMHRDALGSGDAVYKTMAEEEGVCASQVMILTGSDASGLEHPYWRENLKLGLYLQNAVSIAHPTLMRPLDLVCQRYNQNLSTGMLILEVGSSGNTLQEALAGIRLFTEAAAPAILELVE